MQGMIHEECGVFGIWRKDNADIAKSVYYGLIALQHRGQEAAGIAINEDRIIRYHKGLGLVHEVFDNKASGYRRLARWVKSQSDGLTAESWLFCGENTGGYSTALSNYLYSCGYDMWLECAYRIKHSSGIQRVKNDRADSRAIAEYAMRNHDKMVAYKPQSPSRVIRGRFL